ncbi:MAG: hypothetical protein R6V55_15150 [Desulfovermiculus sp.]
MLRLGSNEGYADFRSGNKGNLLSVDLGMKEWDEHKPKEIVRKHREFVYETGAVDASPVKCSEAALSQTGSGQAKGLLSTRRS